MEKVKRCQPKPPHSTTQYRKRSSKGYRQKTTLVCKSKQQAFSKQQAAIVKLRSHLDKPLPGAKRKLMQGCSADSDGDRTMPLPNPGSIVTIIIQIIRSFPSQHYNNSACLALRSRRHALCPEFSTGRTMLTIPKCVGCSKFCARMGTSLLSIRTSSINADHDVYNSIQLLKIIIKGNDPGMTEETAPMATAPNISAETDQVTMISLNKNAHCNKETIIIIILYMIIYSDYSLLKGARSMCGKSLEGKGHKVKINLRKTQNIVRIYVCKSLCIFQCNIEKGNILSILSHLSLINKTKYFGLRLYD